MCNTSCSSVIIYLCKSTVSRIQRDRTWRGHHSSHWRSICLWSSLLMKRLHVPLRPIHHDSIRTILIPGEEPGETIQRWTRLQLTQDEWPRQLRKATSMQISQDYCLNALTKVTQPKAKLAWHGHCNTPQGCATHMYVSLAIQKHSIPYVLPN